MAIAFSFEVMATGYLVKALFVWQESELKQKGRDCVRERERQRER